MRMTISDISGKKYIQPLKRFKVKTGLKQVKATDLVFDLTTEMIDATDEEIAMFKYLLAKYEIELVSLFNMYKNEGCPFKLVETADGNLTVVVAKEDEEEENKEPTLEDITVPDPAETGEEETENTETSYEGTENPSEGDTLDISWK